MKIFYLFWLTTFTLLALTTNSQAENTWAQKRFIEGRWGAEAGDGFVFILTTSADLECNFDRWLGSDNDEYPCSIEETDAIDSMHNGRFSEPVFPLQFEMNFQVLDFEKR